MAGCSKRPSTLFSTLILPLLLIAANGAHSAAVILTDDTFDALVTDEHYWMVVISAPWCVHCRQLEPLWNAFSEDSERLNIKVGKIDGTKEYALSGRFHCKGFPSIYLLRNGSAWAYEGGRTVKDFRDFALTGYKNVDAIPFYKSPIGVVGRIMGKVYGLPSIGRQGYNHLSKDLGYSDMSIVLFLLSLPVIIGALLICALDGFILRRALKEDLPHSHQE